MPYGGKGSLLKDFKCLLQAGRGKMACTSPKSCLAAGCEGVPLASVCKASLALAPGPAQPCQLFRIPFAQRTSPARALRGAAEAAHRAVAHRATLASSEGQLCLARGPGGGQGRRHRPRCRKPISPKLRRKKGRERFLQLFRQKPQKTPRTNARRVSCFQPRCVPAARQTASPL